MLQPNAMRGATERLVNWGTRKPDWNTNVKQAEKHAEAAGRDTPRERVYAAIRDLALELHPAWSRSLVVRPGSDLDRELGYDSLARAELLLRLNRAFGIALPDQLIVEAATAGDIAERSRRPRRGRPRRCRRPPCRRRPCRRLAAPEDAATLVEVLAAHVRAHPDRTHVHLWQGEQAEAPLSYGALDRAARTVAQGLVAAGVERGDRVGDHAADRASPSSRPSSARCYAGAVPVPIYPPLRPAQIEEHLRRQAGILRNAEAAVLITDEATRRCRRGCSPGWSQPPRASHTVAELAASGSRWTRRSPRHAARRRR